MYTWNKIQDFYGKSGIQLKQHSLRQKTELNLKHKLMKSSVQFMDLNGTENSTLRNADQKYLDSFEMWC